ncbi:Patatin-like phospholipase domain-containing protein 7 [Schistosoma japonicum]|nr:Patatin-like phospholipase domain-containing protein 7 [Schistosoma japonicum]
MLFFNTVYDSITSLSLSICETFCDLTKKLISFYYDVIISIREGILAEIFPSLLLSYNATVLLILTVFLFGLSTFLLLRHLKSHVPLRAQTSQVRRGFRRRDKIRYHAIRFGRKFNEITEELKKVHTKEERKTTIVNFAKKIFKLHDSEKSPTLAYGRLPESFFEPDEDDVSSLPEDLRLMISSIRVFGHLEKSFFIEFCKFIETIELHKGEYLFRIGDKDKCVYVIRSGRIQITVTEPDGSKCIIAEVGKGGSLDSLLSVLSILTGYPSTFEFMEASALEPTTVLCLPTQSFLEICKPQTPALFRIIQMIAVRLQRLSFNALHTYLGLSSELINKEYSPFSDSSKSHEFLCKIFEKKHIENLNEFGNINLKYSDLDFISPEVKFTKSPTIDEQKFKSLESELDQVLTSNDHSNLDSTFQSGALELGEAPALYSRKKKLPSILSPSQPPSPNCKHHFTNLRRALSLADTSPNLNAKYNYVDGIRDDNRLNDKEEHYDLTNELNFTKDELKEVIKLAEKDLANLLNLTDSSILHGHVSLVSLSADFVLSRESEMQLEMYYVIYGQLKVFQSSGEPDNDIITMFTCGPGEVVGLLGLITGEPNIYGIQATTKTIVAVLSRERFYSVVRQYPRALFSVTHIISSHLSPLFHQLDFAMEWLSVKSGKALYKKGDIANHVYVVLSGRLRQVDSMPDGSHRIVSELGRGDLVGFLEVFSQQTRISTVMAIRDSELAQIPSHLLHHLKNKVPQVLTRIIQLLSDKLLGNLTTGSSVASPLGMPILHMTSTNSLVTGGLGYTSGGNSNMDVLYSPLNSGVMTNLRTIAVLPSTTDINAEAFTLELQHSMSPMGSSIRLTSDIVMKRLGSSAFDSVSQYRLSTWLSHQEDSHRIVFFVCDCQRASIWNRICIRQADCILVLALCSSDPARPSPMEMALKNDPTKVAKVLVLMYPLETDYPESGKTAVWLNARPWISQHYHIRCEPRVFIPRSKLNLISFYTKVFTREKPNPLSDFSRLARYLVGEAVGLVLGGGGARGCSHVGLIRAFQEAGIPIDLVGGTSIGAFMGALWADETRVAQFTQRARNFTNCFNSIWKKIKDFTYPAVSIFSGKELNRQLQSTFHERQIEDFWLPFFCVTTDITNCKMRIHTQGSSWRYIRASMSLSGYLPPLCDPYDGSLLLDGGYTNNLPADVMVCFGAKTIFANDVGAAVETELANYGDHLSGWYLLYTRFFRVGSPVLRIPSLTEIQARLAYISCVRQLEYIKASGICFYLRPPIDKYMTLQFSAFDEITNVGYDYIKGMLGTWHEEGRLQTLIPGVKPHFFSWGTMSSCVNDSLSSSHLTSVHPPDSFTPTATHNWLTQSFSDQYTFIDLAECVAKTSKPVNSSVGLDGRSNKYHIKGSINVQNFSQFPNTPCKTTVTDISTPTNATVSSASSIAMKIFPKSTHTISNLVSRHIGTDQCLQSASSSKNSSSNEQHYQKETKNPFDFLKNDLTCKNRRRFMSNCYNVDSPNSYLNSKVMYAVNCDSMQNKLSTHDTCYHYHHLRRCKSDHDVQQIHDNSRTLNLVINNDLMDIDQVVDVPSKSSQIANYSLYSFKSLEDDGYLEDDESSTDSAHSPVTASDPELRHDIYLESNNAEEKTIRQRSNSTYRISPYLLNTELSKKRSDSPSPVKHACIKKGQQLNDINAFGDDTMFKLDMMSMRSRTKQNRKRHHRSSLDRLRADRDRGAASCHVNLP